LNYFEHHIGDYDQATAHLTACEDGIYSRLIRWYMASEQPLPADLKLIQRRVRAHTRDERAAVQTVLDEFFHLAEDGYHQHRCDEEVARYQDKQAKAKRSADARWSAHRSQSEGNANASTDDMRTHMRTQSEGNAPRGRTPARAPARPQTPDTSLASEMQTGGAGERAPASPKPMRPDAVPEQVWSDWLALRKAKKAPVTQTVIDNATSEAGKAGMTLEAFLRVWCARGSQGLQADWLTPQERPQPRANGHDTEPEWRREQRERNREALGPYAAKSKTVVDITPTEGTDAPASLLG
jgi:uncharacterized protein YdaU (DUF1376 family)